ncbi:hypothetical protein X975_01386, partial [Stegodyphus mimosarum]
MTLVLPFGGDQITNNPLFTGSGSVRNSNMPCGFDGEPLDFESALMRDWSTDITDYSTPSEDSSMRTPSDTNDLKRKISTGISDSHQSCTKKSRIEEEAATPLQSDIVSSSSSTNHENTITSSISFIQTPLVNSGASSSSSSSSSSSDGQEDDHSAEADDEDYIPRRRGPQMWNSRQRWKDERKKVLKMSINKLAEIEDPELCLLRSVLINNTIKKLHLDIRNERQAKLRHRQQRMDYFAERFQPLNNTLSNVSSNHFASDFDSNGSNGRCASEVKQSTNSSNTNASDLYDESSCDEIFGISEDFLRVIIPDRRVSSPIPTSPVNQSCMSETAMDTSEGTNNNSNEETMDTVTVTSRSTSDGADCPTSCYNNNTSSPSCDSAVDCASPYYNRRIQNNSQTVTSMSSSPSAVFSPSSPSPSRRLVSTGSSQCATQFRTNRELTGSSSGGGTFTPSFPVLESVVYHSLMATLETSS